MKRWGKSLKSLRMSERNTNAEAREAICRCDSVYEEIKIC
jgi:hypothetical protein